MVTLLLFFGGLIITRKHVFNERVGLQLTLFLIKA